MKLLAPLVLACLAASALAKIECYSNRGENLIQFNGRGQDIFFPCKYWALRQQRCGKYSINLSPGNRWIYPKYQLDTMWLGIDDTETGEFWEGRTTNKLAVKYLNSKGLRDLFNKKDGTVATSDRFVFGRMKKGVYIQDHDQTFRVTFTPWDPRNRRDYPNSDWKFECFTKQDPPMTNYSTQLCGSLEKRVVTDRAKDVFGLPDRFRANVIYFDTLTNRDIVHTNPKCYNATDILTLNCKTDAQRMLVINNCKDILLSQRHTECVTNYNCDPMDVFNDCVSWGCLETPFDPTNTPLCQAVAEGIDYCPEFGSSGNLTARVEEAKCLKNFLRIEE